MDDAGGDTWVLGQGPFLIQNVSGLSTAPGPLSGPGRPGCGSSPLLLHTSHRLLATGAMQTLARACAHAHNPQPALAPAPPPPRRQVTSSVYATPVITDLYSDGRRDIIVPGFVHYLEVLQVGAATRQETAAAVVKKRALKKLLPCAAGGPDSRGTGSGPQHGPRPAGGGRRSCHSRRAAVRATVRGLAPAAP